MKIIVKTKLEVVRLNYKSKCNKSGYYHSTLRYLVNDYIKIMRSFLPPKKMMLTTRKNPYSEFYDKFSPLDSRFIFIDDH